MTVKPSPPARGGAAPRAKQRRGGGDGANSLIETCLWVYDTHDAASTSLDAHIEACLAARGFLNTSADAAPAAVDNSADADAAAFVSQVVYGLHRFRRFLSAFLEGFFHVNRCVVGGWLK
jgi:hypothetical protein